MKILHINSYYSVSNFYKNLYDKQIENGLDIDVYVPVSTAKDTSDLELGKYSKISQNHNKYDRLFFHIKHNKIYKDIIKQYKMNEYPILHAHSLFSNGYIAYKLNKKYKIPYIVAVRNTDINVFFKKMKHLRRLGVNILRNAEKVIFISKPYKEYTMEKFIPSKYKEEIESKSIVIPNGIDKFWIDNKVTTKEKPRENEINIIYVGVVNSNKNIETTTKACEILIKQGYKVNYKIIGKIKDKKYNDFIKKYPFIKYISHCPKEELIKHYRSSDIFIMPSKHETFGLVYAEAMSQGLPLIYTRGQGFDGQFEEGEVGYSVECDSQNDIADRVKDIISNYGNMSFNCIEKVDKFNWDKMDREYLKLYKKILLRDCIL